MLLGVISDVHGNLPALDTVLESLPPVDELVCAGDVVGYNPWPEECVTTLSERDVPTVSGNHDRAVTAATGFRFNSMAAAGVDFAREELSPESLDWLESLPETRTVANGRVRLAHGHPDDPDRYTYPEGFSPALLSGEDLLVLGHTHIQGHEIYDEGIVLNPGSVGQPRDGDPRAAYAVVDLETMTVEEHRVNYDIDRVAERVREVGLPKRLASRLYEGK
ncbi:metallophosphoesterase [Haloferax mediterranei ATCC 33500]|uniref:Phosphoesterase n=1 Tax=Haloferax mediterranei (strain ATCC 33500 / DSM 1411 / JCM 8866 / NBRC 14739 / NCIMB 2177 / R-4) TaxID=523841 RepID=I3R0J4_HALMT|nr:metallophosphoesterase family protein [Haloferax mediterranei]AFK17754.1 DNA repair protein [Haloferax mediterranei ATCC 33500]AHZ22814.1 DNA repair protein [Haloferax mediterranei ATCC 33500]EMA02974.1 DNA repair protein [Haloferax mediterranei ATCC 33500]MDX5987843.1 metallophosphoesterase family protein [Haloferax mediterranei ATCC 33500]QCQ74319.1 metallophosphoesterase [Haloferax mediterranei ATCC 33500]